MAKFYYNYSNRGTTTIETRRVPTDVCRVGIFNSGAEYIENAEEIRTRKIT